jgi:2-oxoglutarate ferredoxin oxidoreductase subunit beta
MSMAKTAAKLTPKDFASSQDLRWCPGCGDYSVLANVQRVLPELGVPRENFVFVSGIGCSSRFPYYMNTYGFHTIHGRAPAFAAGIKASRPDLSVWVVTGDGDGLSIGGNHLLHTIRRNLDIQILLFNNRVLGAGATFVARAVDVDAPHLQQVLRRAYEHKGTAFVEILQNCPVYNDDEWIEVEDRKNRVENAIKLQNGQPLLCGSQGHRRGIRIDDGIPSVVDLDDEADPVGAGVAVHNERYETPAYAFVLASLQRPDYPLPIGVFRAVEKPSYETLLEDQVTAAIAGRGEGNLETLLNSGDTWTVEA